MPHQMAHVGGKCGKPKKGHVCVAVSSHPKHTADASCQAVIDPLMTIEEMKKDSEWRTKVIKCNFNTSIVQVLIPPPNLIIFLKKNCDP